MRHCYEICPLPIAQNIHIHALHPVCTVAVTVQYLYLL